MQTATLRRSGFLLLGTAITVTQVVRTPWSVVISACVGTGLWLLNRYRHRRSMRHHHHHPARRVRHLRDQVVTAGLATAAVWLLIMVLRGSYELTSMLVSPDFGAGPFDGFPGRGLFEGLLSTTGLTYLVLAIAEQPRRVRRRRSRSSRRGELATVQSQAPDEA